MRKTVLTFGLIAGGILSLMMLITIPFHDAIGFDRGLVIGYASMVAAFLLIYFGVRSYRDTVAGGSISFGRAFSVGALIFVVASLCYVATWQVLCRTVASDYMVKYEEHVIAEERADGATQAEIDAKVAEMRRWAEMYRNPLVNVAVTFLEPLPVGLIMTLIAAGVLSRKRNDDASHAMASTG
jgi:hypothetical protein